MYFFNINMEHGRYRFTRTNVHFMFQRFEYFTILSSTGSPLLMIILSYSILWVLMQKRSKDLKKLF